MTTPLLSICIPTYKRPEFLTECLESLACQNLDYVEIIIRDNSSRDSTISVLEKFSLRLPLRYEIGLINEGADRNFGKVVALARGEYCWILGDDDIVLSDSINKIKSFLSENRPSILQLGYIQGTSTLEHVNEVLAQGTYIDSGTSFRMTNIANYYQKQPNISILFAFISNFIFHRSCWDFTKQAEKWYDTHYVHSYQMHNAIASQKNIKILKLLDPAVVARGNIANVITSKIGEIMWLDARTLSNICKTIYGNDDHIRRSFSMLFRKTYSLKTIMSVLAQTHCAIDKPTTDALAYLGVSKNQIVLAKILGRPIIRNIALKLFGSK